MSILAGLALLCPRDIPEKPSLVCSLRLLKLLHEATPDLSNCCLQKLPSWLDLKPGSVVGSWSASSAAGRKSEPQNKGVVGREAKRRPVPLGHHHNDFQTSKVYGLRPMKVIPLPPHFLQTLII